MKPFTHALLVLTHRDPILSLVYVMDLLVPVFWQWLAGTLQHFPTEQQLTSVGKQGTQTAPFAFGFCPVPDQLQDYKKKGSTF